MTKTTTHIKRHRQRSLMAACVFFMLTLVMVSCGPDSQHYALDGHLLNMNQGEFLIYSPDGAINSVDTAYVEGGRFEVEGKCNRPGTLLILMPNGAEVAVFVEPGASISLNGNAQNLRQVEVKGPEENSLMNRFRKETANANLVQIEKKITEYVKEEPQSRVCFYLIRRYLVESEKPNYDKALKLIASMRKADSSNEQLKMYEMMVKELKKTDVGAQLPNLNLTDVNGKDVSDATLRKGITILMTTASYDFDSTNQVRRVSDVFKNQDKKVNIIAISVDAARQQCTNSLQSVKDDVTIICDETMTETPAAQKLMASQIGTVIVVKDGKIIERSLTGEPLYNFLRELIVDS